VKIKNIYLYPDLVEFQSDALRPFRDQTRYICNFIQRYLKSHDLEANGFNKICIVCKSVPRGACYVNSSNALIIEIPFCIDDYCSIAKEDLPEYFISLLNIGFDKGSKEFSLPIGDICTAVNLFRNTAYENKYVFLERNFKLIGLKCRLLCAFKMSYFSLTFEAIRGSELVFSQEILRTIPDEVVFSHKFKEIKFIDGQLIVVDKFGSVIFSWTPVS
jgi:hypothetical protein